MAITSKWFKAGTAGPSADGRVVEEKWLKDIAETYDRNEYEASVFLDHIRYFGNYGTVAAVKLEKDDKKRTCLFLQIEPTPDLLHLNQNHQYQYPSIGIDPDFQNSGKAYLVNLGAVTQPGSIGTKPMEFNASEGQTTQLECFACEDPAAFNLLPENEDEAQGFFNKMKQLFNSEDSPMSKAALAELSAQIKQLQTDFAAMTPPTKGGSEGGDVNGKDDLPAEFAAQFAALQKDFEEFKTAHKSPDTPNTEFADLGTKVTELALKLDDALKEQGGTDSGDHSEAFSAVQII